MARAMTIQRAMVPATERTRYMAKLRDRRVHYQKENCRFWVFEEIGLPGLFMEFTEAQDAATLAAAHAKAPERPRDPTRVYAEVEVE